MKSQRFPFGADNRVIRTTKVLFLVTYAVLMSFGGVLVHVVPLFGLFWFDEFWCLWLKYVVGVCVACCFCRVLLLVRRCEVVGGESDSSFAVSHLPESSEWVSIDHIIHGCLLYLAVCRHHSPNCEHTALTFLTLKLFAIGGAHSSLWIGRER